MTRIVEEIGRVRLVLTEPIEARVLISGFHGVGHVGWIATRYIADKLGTRRVGVVVTPDMPAFVSVKNSVIAPYELHLKENYLFFVTNTPLSQRDISRVPLALAEFALKSGVEETILFGGLDRRFATEGDETVRIAPTRKYIERHSSEISWLKVIEEGLGIVGPLALMLAIYEAYDSSAAAILPYASPDRPDPLAASKAIEVANRLLSLNVDTEELREEAVLLERRIEEIQRRISELTREREPPSYHV